MIPELVMKAVYLLPGGVTSLNH